MHSQLINALGGEIHRHHTCACFQSDFDALSLGWIALNWAAIQGFGHLFGAKIMQIVSFNSHSQMLPTISANLPCSCTISLRCLSFFRCSARFSSPPWSSTSGLLLYATKISVKSPIRQTWPNKHHSYCQLGDFSSSTLLTSRFDLFAR